MGGQLPRALPGGVIQYENNGTISFADDCRAAAPCEGTGALGRTGLTIRWDSQHSAAGVDETEAYGHRDVKTGLVDREVTDRALEVERAGFDPVCLGWTLPRCWACGVLEPRENRRAKDRRGREAGFELLRMS